MKNFTGQKFGIILKDWTLVIKLKNSNGNATIHIKGLFWKVNSQII
jgi:hypothetical protein